MRKEAREKGAAGWRMCGRLRGARGSRVVSRAALFGVASYGRRAVFGRSAVWLHVAKTVSEWRLVFDVERS